MNIPNLNYETVSIREIFKKFKIVDTRLTDNVLDIEIEKVTLKDFKEDDLDGDMIIVTGFYEEPMIKPPNNKVNLILRVDPLDDWNTVTIIKSIPNNFTSGVIYNNEGMPHTMT